MKYNEMEWGTMEAIVNKLGGMTGVKDFLSGKLILKKPDYNFKVWKTLTLGIKTREQYVQSIANAGVRTDESLQREIANQKFPLVKNLEVIKLVLVTVNELGFEQPATYEEIINAGIARELEECPTETALAVCEEYLNQPKGECITFAMQDLYTKPDTRFDLSNNDAVGRILVPFWRPSNAMYQLKDLFVFRVR